MTISISTHESEISKASKVRKNRLKKIMHAWSLTRSSMQGHWEKFKLTPAGCHVPYRVWSRHGAYLEMQRETHRH